jgi:hypothetical protein
MSEDVSESDEPHQCTRDICRYTNGSRDPFRASSHVSWKITKAMLRCSGLDRLVMRVGDLNHEETTAMSPRRHVSTCSAT